MPLYEYSCRKCSKRFEFLVMGSDKPACPKCHGRDLQRLFSTFAVSGAGRKSDSDSFGDLGGDPGGDLGGSDFGGGMGGGFDPGGDAGDDDPGADPGGMGGAGDDASSSWDDD